MVRPLTEGPPSSTVRNSWVTRWPGALTFSTPASRAFTSATVQADPVAGLVVQVCGSASQTLLVVGDCSGPK